MSDSLAIIQQNKITELRNSLADALDFTEVQQARIKQLEVEVRNAHFDGYMAGVGDSEDYDHDARVMEKIAWKYCLEAQIALEDKDE
jgi:hypothetical protein